jgi:hypothetical protein
MVCKKISIQPRYRNAEPYIRQFRDLTDPEKAWAHHPFVIGEYVRNEVMDWRAAQERIFKSRLKALKRQSSTTKVRSDMLVIEGELESIRFSLPPKFRKQRKQNTHNRRDNREE